MQSISHVFPPADDTGSEARDNDQGRQRLLLPKGRNAPEISVRQGE